MEGSANVDWIKTLSFPSTTLGGEKRYEVVYPIEDLQGKYGMVLKIEDRAIKMSSKRGRANTRAPKSDIYAIRALKILKPNKFLSEEKLKGDFLSEIETLSQLEHPNLPRIYDWGEATCEHYPEDNIEQSSGKGRTNKKATIKKIPFYVMEYVEGGDLQKRISSDEVFSAEFFIQLVLQTLSALECCYDNNVIHLDIKPDNILVSEKPNGELRFVLTDFGKAKIITESPRTVEDRAYDTVGGGVFKYIHPVLWKYLKNSNVSTRKLHEYRGVLDLYSIGKVFEDVYKKVSYFSMKDQELNPWIFFFHDLCYSDEIADSRYLINYLSAPQAFRTARRISVEKSINAFPLKFHKDEKGIALIRLAESETSPFPADFEMLVETAEFQKLRFVSQLGQTDLVYPGATHNRFLHSLGTFYRTLFYVSALQRQSLFNYLFDDEDVENLLITALLHDIGHYPYAHYFEEIEGLGDLNVHHEDIAHKIFNDEISIKKSVGERFTDEYFSRIKIKVLREENLSAKSIGEILSERNKVEMINKIWKGEGKYCLFKDILSGPIDSDKLDYLLRDSKHTGVPYARSIDLERFYYSLTLDTSCLSSQSKGEASRRGEINVRLAITAKGKSTVESIISARYNLFSEVYWHKTCRAAAAMMKDALWYARENISQSEFEWAAMLMNDTEYLLWLCEKLKDDERAVDLLGGLKIGFKRRIYKRLKTYSKDYKEAEKINLYHKFSSLSNNFKIIHEHKNKLVELLNSKGRVISGWQKLKPHHLIVDIPNVKQDPADPLQVKYPPTIKGKIFYDLKDVSKISESIYDTLATSTKKIRLFCHPDYFEQLVSLGNLLESVIDQSFQRTQKRV